MRRFIFAAILTTGLLIGAPLGAQEDELKAAVEGAIAAWNSQDAAGFCEYWDVNYQGFNWTGGLMAVYPSCDPATMQPQFDAGYVPAVTIRHLTVRIHENSAAVACYFDGTITMGPETVYMGPFRFTSAWVRSAGGWKMVQFHFSPLDP